MHRQSGLCWIGRDKCPGCTVAVVRLWVHRVGGLLWTMVWLFPLASVFPAVGSALDVVGLAAFAVGYTVVTWSAFEVRGWRRTRLAGLAVVAVLGYGQAVLHGSEWLILPLFVAACGVAVFGASPEPGPAVGVFLTTEAVIIAIAVVRGYEPILTAAYVVGTFMSSAIVFSVRQMNRLIRELHETRRALAVAAVAEERLRFARDLHDLLGHTLSVIVVKAEAVRRLADRDPAAVASHARDIEDVGRRALAEVREAVTGYRDGDLPAEVERARQTLRAADIDVTVHDASDEVPSRAAAALAWVIREGVTNVVRHSGARHCAIAIVTADGRTTVELRDDGPPCPAPVFGNGLRGLAERLARDGGTLDAGPVAGGFALTATVPIGGAG